MNRALLRQLQTLRAYPSVTLLHSTEPGPRMDAPDAATLRHLVEHVRWRLADEVSDDVREYVLGELSRLVQEAVDQPATRAIAICVSPNHSSIVRLARAVRTRSVVDETFATRDMVADERRTAVFRVITLSDRMVRILVGDRERAAEHHDPSWPLVREAEESEATWSRRVSERLRREMTEHPIPTVIAGVNRSVRDLLRLHDFQPIGTVTGNHDRTGWDALHRLTWPLVESWLARDETVALERLDRARNARRFAGGLDEVWDLAHDGRVQMLVVEDQYEVPARIVDNRLVPVADPTLPEVVDDAVDELIEMVMLHGGDIVVVSPGRLVEHGHVAAALRY